MTRQQKSPRQRAEERLGIATRKVEKLNARKATLTAELRDVGTELTTEQKRLEHAKTDPDLPLAAPRNDDKAAKKTERHQQGGTDDVAHR